jgi:hypothetical protein
LFSLLGFGYACWVPGSRGTAQSPLSTVQVQVFVDHGFLLDLLWRVGYNPSAPPSSSG